jgi:hypothetical protein
MTSTAVLVRHTLQFGPGKENSTGAESLNREWQESVEIARKKPDLKTLEATIKLN